MDRWIRFGLLCVSSLALAAAVPGGGALTATQPIVVQRHPGFFDYMTMDGKYRRLLVAHAADDALAIVDVQSGSVTSQVDLGAGAGGHGVAVDERDGKYFVGADNDHLVDINRKNMVLQAFITMPGPIDAIAFDPKNDTIYADELNGTHVWAVNAKSNRIVATIAVAGKPEYVEYDPVSDRIYQNIDLSPSTVDVIDPATNSVTATWPVAPADKVHGLAVDAATGRLFTVGANGKLAIIDVKSGSVVTTLDVASRVDQIAFDPSTKRVYCPSGTGVMSVVQETDAGASLLDTITIPRGTHTVTVDPQTHDVWISYGAPDNDYVEKLTPNV